MHLDRLISKTKDGARVVVLVRNGVRNGVRYVYPINPTNKQRWRTMSHAKP